MKITKAGTVLTGLDIHGFVTIAAPNVTIKNSIIRGGKATGFTALVKNLDKSATNFVLTDSELVPQFPSVYIDGLMGANYTAIRLNIHGGVDGAKVLGDNTTIRNSYLHDTVTYAHDPNQGGGRTHNDAIQVLGGNNVKIYNNSVIGGANSALQVTQQTDNTNGLVFANNWVGGGGCSVNVAVKGMSAMTGVNLSGNRFYRTSIYKCPMIVDTTVKADTSNNRYLDNNAAIAINWRTPK